MFLNNVSLKKEAMTLRDVFRRGACAHILEKRALQGDNLPAGVLGAQGPQLLQDPLQGTRVPSHRHLLTY